MANKNSTYIQSLVSFVLDTKPYHSKLTEINEIYQFSEVMNVNISERLFNSTMTKAAWPYSYFSSGVSLTTPLLPIHRLVNPLFRTHYRNDEQSINLGGFKINRDENTDLPLVPLAFDPKCLSGVGISDAFVQRQGIAAFSEPILEGHDFYQSHGAYVFQIKQTLGSQAPFYAPRFTERSNENLLAHATTVVQYQALDVLNPSSAVNLIKDIMSLISTQLTITPDITAATELVAINSILNTPLLPSNYEALLNALVLASIPVIPGYAGWIGQDITVSYTDKYVNQVLESYSPALYFNAYTDIVQRENGELNYKNITQNGLTVSSIVGNTSRAAYEEWTIEVITASSFIVTGSETGIIGSGSLGAFSSPQLTFNTSGSLVVGNKVVITPSAKITIHENAPLEAWSLIKVNPKVYSRPILNSTRYGYVIDAIGTPGKITIGVSVPTTTIVLTAISANTFEITSSADSLYSGIATVGTQFNDGQLQFTIIAGSAYTFNIGDKFFINIVNDAPLAQDLDLFYGYDMDPYDANEMVYNTISNALDDYLTTLDFGYDSRFISYDLASFGLSIGQNALDNRQWRLRALADLGAPLPLSTGPTNNVNQIATNDPTNPNAPTQFDMPNDVTSEGPQSATDPDLLADLQLWYSNLFALEYYDSNLLSWVFVDNISVGSSYTNLVHGISFNLIATSKPFIACKLNSSYFATVGGPELADTVDGGDVISWTVKNNLPVQTEIAGLTSAKTPRLVMHGDSYQHSIPATWVLSWTSNTSYTIQGTYSTGINVGSPVFLSPLNVLTTNGDSFRNDDVGVHFTIKGGVASLAAGDSFTFETYESKPTFLVHGSVSGWQQDAEFDKYYWNGKIGFKLNSPTVQLFENAQLISGSPWSTSVGTVVLERVRLDAPTLTYTLKAHVNNHWMLYKNGEIVADGELFLEDKYLRLTVPPAIAGTSIVIQVSADNNYNLSLGVDLAIVKTDAGRTPVAGDYVLVERTEADDIQISIKAKDPAHALVLADLAPVTIDVRFVDHTANSGVPLSNTSPEVNVLSGWLPALTTFKDNLSSTAEFSDAATNAIVRAAATGETVGTIESLGSTVNDLVVFKWDEDFHTKYLPLNAEATIVTLGSGMDERMNVTMREGIMFFISGGGLETSALFNENIIVNMVDDSLMNITVWPEDIANIDLDDTSFTGFLPGYDNTRFDFETEIGDLNDENGGGGSYDTGAALTDYYEQAKVLAALPVLSVLQQETLVSLISQIQEYLVNGDLSLTTFSDFITALNSDPNIGVPTLYGFGVPDAGLGIDINQNSSSSANTSINEALVMIVSDFGYTYDQHGFGVGPLDTAADTLASISTDDLPPIPSTGLPTFGTLYANFETPLVVNSPGARIIDVYFTNPLLSTPVFYVWRPTDIAPPGQPGGSIALISNMIAPRRFRLSLPTISECKLIITY